MQMTTKWVSRITGWDRKKMEGDIYSGNCGFVPAVHSGLRFWDVDDVVAALFYINNIDAGDPVKVAGRDATHLREGMRAHPDADQLTIIAIENGSRSIMPTDRLDLSTGYLSGGYLASALTIDVRNLRARIERAIEADAALVGDAEDA